jgi:hypothetical protein
MNPFFSDRVAGPALSRPARHRRYPNSDNFRIYPVSCSESYVIQHTFPDRQDSEFSRNILDLLDLSQSRCQLWPRRCSNRCRTSSRTIGNRECRPSSGPRIRRRERAGYSALCSLFQRFIRARREIVRSRAACAATLVGAVGETLNPSPGTAVERSATPAPLSRKPARPPGPTTKPRNACGPGVFIAGAKARD